jgi:hypothetical protein
MKNVQILRKSTAYRINSEVLVHLKNIESPVINIDQPFKDSTCLCIRYLTKISKIKKIAVVLPDLS